MLKRIGRVIRFIRVNHLVLVIAISFINWHDKDENIRISKLKN